MNVFNFPYELELLDSTQSDSYNFVLKIPKSTQTISDKPHNLKGFVESLKLTLPILIEEEQDKDSVKVRSLRKLIEDLAFIENDILTMKDAYLQIINSKKRTAVN